MRVRVRLLGSLRPAKRHGEVEVTLPEDSNLTTLIDYISEEYPEVAGSLRGPSGNLIIVNGVEAGNLEGLATLLREGSEVVLVPVTHGG
ncbi:MAG: MoaD/ThiS family protein [Candidatus Bathyarchaeota archaeon]|nr:MoaD/ThiS family protein [Candidatus Bathyarchaeota archaeon]